MRQDWISRLSILGGALFLVLGVLTADVALGGDYDDEYRICGLICTMTNGKDMDGVQWYDLNGNPSIEACIANGCAKYKNINCGACTKCPGGGYEIPCTNTGNNCGGVNACSNGFCVCKSYSTPEATGTFYDCSCGRP